MQRKCLKEAHYLRNRSFLTPEQIILEVQFTVQRKYLEPKSKQQVTIAVSFHSIHFQARENFFTLNMIIMNFILLHY